LRVVLVIRAGRPSRLHSLLQIGLVWCGWLNKRGQPSREPVRGHGGSGVTGLKPQPPPCKVLCRPMHVTDIDRFARCGC
jgi:hypothetical protein